MAVIVKHIKDSGVGAATATHDAGTNFNVQDGHLFVLGSASVDYATNEAVYAPGRWISAEVVLDK